MYTNLFRMSIVRVPNLLNRIILKDYTFAIILALAIQNLEAVIIQAGYEPSGMVRLTVYTTSSAEFFGCFDVLQNWIRKH